MIYVDEAGTSAKEPVSVVAGVVVDADRQWVPAYERVGRLLSRVPEQHREGFVFHATDLWNDKRFRDGWPFEERMQLIIDMASIPRELGIPVAVGAVGREMEPPADVIELVGRARAHHAFAFALALTSADSHIRDFGHPEEVAIVVSEDVPDQVQRRAIRAFVAAMSMERIAIEPGQHFGAPRGDMIQTVSRVIDTVHFVGKREAHILPIADACAFILRRYIAGLSMGEKLAVGMLDSNLSQFYIPRVPDVVTYAGLLWKRPGTQTLPPTRPKGVQSSWGPVTLTVPWMARRRP